MSYFLARVDSLSSLCMDYVVKNLVKYAGGENVEYLPSNIKKRIFNKFTSSSYFWRTINFKRALSMLVDQYTEKVDLTLTLVDDEILRILSKCYDIRKMYMTQYENDCLTIQSIINCIPSFQRMEILVMSNCPIVNDDVLTCVAKNCLLLNAIDVCGCSNVADDGVTQISELKDLMSINLSSTQVTNKGIQRLVFGASGTKIRELRIANCKNVQSDILKVITTECPEIEVLVFYDVDIPEDTCDENSPNFGRNNLKNLKMVTWTIKW